MLTKHQSTELNLYFGIKSDLSAATRVGAVADVEFHINELYAMQMHTDSARLRAACTASIREHRRALIPMTA